MELPPRDTLLDIDWLVYIHTPDPIALGRFGVIGRGLSISPDGTRLATS
jgi:hypothetical protein